MKRLSKASTFLFFASIIFLLAAGCSWPTTVFVFTLLPDPGVAEIGEKAPLRALIFNDAGPDRARYFDYSEFVSYPLLDASSGEAEPANLLSGDLPFGASIRMSLNSQAFSYYEIFKDGRVDLSLVQSVSVELSAVDSSIVDDGQGGKTSQDNRLRSGVFASAESKVPVYGSDLAYLGNEAQAILEGFDVGTGLSFSYTDTSGLACGCAYSFRIDAIVAMIE